MLSSFITYNLIAGISLGVFYILYKLLFSKTTFFALNRNYLLGSMLLSFTIPFIKFTIPTTAGNLSNDFVIYTFNEMYNQAHVNIPPIIDQASWGWFELISFIYIVGAAFIVFKLIRHIFKIVKIILSGRKDVIDNKKVVIVKSSIAPFSFFRFIVLSEAHSKSNDIGQILAHEKVHQKQLHSLDLLFAELLSVLQWFNPIVFAYKKSLNEMHEYIADTEVVENGVDELIYQKALIDQQYSQLSFAMTNSFNQSLLKKRIRMMAKSRSSMFNILRYILIIPIVLVLLSAFSMERAIPKFKTGVQLNIPIYPESNIPKGKPIKDDQLKRVSWDYGQEAKHPITGKLVTHWGVDMVAEEGTPVLATASGIVVKAKNASGWGLYVGINHEDGYSTFYSHLQKYTVKEGDQVRRGQVIGYVGNTGMSTGPHLHYEVRKDNKRVNPANFY